MILPILVIIFACPSSSLVRVISPFRRATSFGTSAAAGFLKTTRPTITTLYIGKGVAKCYRWKEEPNEIEVTVTVPPSTRTKDIVFKVTPTSVDLRYVKNDTSIVLLDGSRPLRGKVSMDGTFWSISDNEERSGREVTVMIEKNKRKGEFEVETDWEGVFEDEEDDDIISRVYRVPEELDVRDYCKRELNVDIDNIDMSKVDKTMFSTTNMTQNVLQDLKKGGYVREVTRQGDLEFIEENDGSQKEFKQSIPFIDNEDSSAKTANDSSETFESSDNTAAGPIDRLTVARLKEILREQNLKVSGTKQELQERLRNHVQSVIDKNK